ncbi:helix-turn-helix domain of resolvase [Rubidibacter lacunae KORDI 51-2]|uniref:Helix-turn-helix domain of resolvase n=1 Tax=Rubidibacter lacunae KORDI 51-2 TaxID=582515 RepID=U5DH77_9CHRO|nr:helix-turn-helix domain-containing protein [Rubidibacter lacunae]ERN39914.1 helix-turn-helix domain of resolvase [Rubidibacter lacunae KORDI 51-2]
MSPKKLSDTDQQEVVRLYRKTDETTSTLAKRFQVGNSTVSRILKRFIAEDEYGQLVRQKQRHGRNAHRSIDADNSVSEAVDAEVTPPMTVIASKPPADAATTEGQPSVRRRRRSSLSSASDERSTQTELLLVPKAEPDVQEEEPTFPARPILKRDRLAAADATDSADGEDFSTLREMYGSDIDFDDADDHDVDEDDLDDDDDSLLDGESEGLHARATSESVRVLPFAAAEFPRTCYLVVDKTGDLISPPLKDFSDLGTIPDLEEQQKTLPVFDNHRVARRFATNRFQRVIKVPDGQMLRKTRSHLEAKGITRLLLDGRVYSLSAPD